MLGDDHRLVFQFQLIHGTMRQGVFQEILIVAFVIIRTKMPALDFLFWPTRKPR